MKRTDRQKKSIIIAFLLTFIIFLGGIYIWLYNITPAIYNIEAKKLKVSEIQHNIKNIRQKGLPFKTFKELTSELNIKWKDWEYKIKDSIYLQKLIKDKKTNNVFYKKNFINNWNITYKIFLLNKDKEIKLALEKSSLWIENDIKKILPNYSWESISFGSWEILTDFKFINYLESLFKGFNLEYNGSLWINNIQNYYKWGWSLDTSIFFIPLSFNLKGKKKDIINFIHFFENVWSLSVLWEKLSLKNDNFIQDNFWKKILFSWDKEIKNYYIYNHQFSDISYIKMSKYLDSSNLPRWDNIKLIDFIKKDKNQNNEKYSIDIWLRFYTKGAKTYKIKDYIKKVLTNFKWLEWSIISKINLLKKNKSKDNKDIIKLNKLEKLNKYISWSKLDRNWMEKDLNKSWILNNIYKKAIKYDKIIDNSSIVMWEKIYTKNK